MAAEDHTIVQRVCPAEGMYAYVALRANGRRRTVSLRLCFNACFGEFVDFCGRQAVDQSSVGARVTGHGGRGRRKRKRVRIGLGDVIEGSVLREEWRLGLGKFEHAGVEVADGLIGKVTGMR